MTILNKFFKGFCGVISVSLLSSSMTFANEQNLKRICCAGPQLNDKQKQSMLDIASALEKAGYSTFLSQRDGINSSKVSEYLKSKNYKEGSIKLMVSKATFALDTYQVLSQCDGVVANLVGDMPDDGTISEAAMAWSHKKPVVLYKSDSNKMNSLVHGLSDFKVVKEIKNIPKEMFKASQYSATKKSELELPLIIQKGGLLWDSMQKIQAETAEERNQKISEVIIKLFSKA